MDPLVNAARKTREEIRFCREISAYAARHNRHSTAIRYLDKALDLQWDGKVLFDRAKCYNRHVQPQKALEDGRAAEGLSEEDHYLLRMEIVKAVYEMNDLEMSQLETYKWKNHSNESKAYMFESHNTLVQKDLKNCLGNTWKDFMLKNTPVLSLVQEQRMQEKKMRPLWKIRRDQRHCDVVSEKEKKPNLIHPLELQKRQRASKVFNEYYLGRSAVDFEFLENLRNNEALFRPESRITTPILRERVNLEYDAVKRLVKMLHTRSPLYNEIPKRFPNIKMYAQHRQNSLYRIQYNTRREMHVVLETIRWLKRFNAGEVKKVSRYVEDVMTKVADTKSDRIMPWKFEFINEVYNLLGLIYVDHYINHFDLTKEYYIADLHDLLRVQKTDITKPNFVFGDRSSYNLGPTYDNSAHRKYLAHLDKRIRFAKYPIERAYLYHEVARANCQKNTFDVSVSAARNAVREAESCNSYLWQLLAVMQSVTVFASKEKTNDCIRALEQATELAKTLNHPVLSTFIETCLMLNRERHRRYTKYGSIGRASQRRGSRLRSRDSLFKSEEDSYRDLQGSVLLTTTNYEK